MAGTRAMRTMKMYLKKIISMICDAAAFAAIMISLLFMGTFFQEELMKDPTIGKPGKAESFYE